MKQKNLEMRPYPNEHSCRLEDPGKYKKFARKNCYKKHDDKCIDYIFGVISADESELQAMRYPKDIWTEDAARDHCKNAGGTFEPAKKEEESESLLVERRFLPFFPNIHAISDIGQRLRKLLDRRRRIERQSNMLGEMATLERRGFTDEELAKQERLASELRALDEEIENGDHAMEIEGYPIVYEKYALLWGGTVREIIHQGAAARALTRSDELVLWDHESSQPMARRSNGTLEAEEDEHGVHIWADVIKSVWGRNGYEAIKNKLIDRMSFAFDVEEDKWHTDSTEEGRIETREILSFDILYDYSPVSYPAYKETVVMARCRDLALRHHPEPGALGDGGRALSEALQMSRDALSQVPWPYLKE